MPREVDLGSIVGPKGPKGDRGPAGNFTASQLSNRDLNTYHGESYIGMYYGDGSNNCTNRPSGVAAFYLEVNRSASGYYYQLMISSVGSTKNTMWIRSFGENAWSPWAQLGKTGATGPKGDKGDAGPQGPKGDPGRDGTVDNIEVTDASNLLGGGSTATYPLQTFLNAVSSNIKKDDGITEAVFSASKWVSADGVYTQSASISGVTVNDSLIAGFVDDSATASEKSSKEKAYNCVSKFETLNGSVKATCKYKKPSVDFKVAFKGV